MGLADLLARPTHASRGTAASRSARYWCRRCGCPCEDEPDLGLADFGALAIEQVIVAARTLKPKRNVDLEDDADDDTDEAGAESAQSIWAERLEALGQFVVAVVLDTPAVSHPGKALENDVGGLLT
jgi:hypothetical protein